VVVIGSGNSGHDIAHDAHLQVTMIQRSSTYVMTLPTTLKKLSARYNAKVPLEDSDLLNSAMPTALTQRIGADVARNCNKMDDSSLKGL